MANADNTTLRLSLTDAKAARARFYWTGVACRNGHLSARYVAGRGCAQCTRERGARDFAARPEYHTAKSRRWYSDKERSRKKTAAWRAANRERDADNRRRYFQRNKEKLLAYWKRWSMAHRAECRAANVRWYSKNKTAQRQRACEKRWRNIQKYRLYSLLYNKANRDLIAVHQRNRRAKIMQSAETHTRNDVHDLYARQSGK